MLLKQIHNLPTGPNWNKIIVTTIAVVGLVIIINFITEPTPLIDTFRGKKKE